MSANTALELEDVVFRYQEKGKRNILDHTSLSIPAGTLTVLMGGSGCGKSTLAAVAAGLYPENGGFLEGGTIRLYGQDLKTLDPQKRAAYLTVLFQKNLQISPGEYIRRIKLQESKQMIRENNLNFTEIAAALQYSTVHHFSRQFKEKFGVSPSEYAKSLQAGND